MYNYYKGIIPEGDNIFIVSKTSCVGGSPCDEAVEFTYTFVQSASDDDLKIFGDNWHKRGTNHRTHGDLYLRDLEVETGYYVKISNIVDFVDKYGDCVVGRCRLSGAITIEIYDTYRE